MEYRIYPPIGIARIGNSDTAFFYGPETPDSNGTELDANGDEVAVTSFKDSAGKMKRMAARFQIYEFDAAFPQGRPAQLPQGTTVRWSVRLANIKDAVERRSSPQREVSGVVPIRPSLENGRENRKIISAVATHDGPNSASSEHRGTYLEGTPHAESVFLGESSTDSAGRLVVLGAHGVSASPEGAAIGEETGGGSYYNNRGWYDDVADGPVTAEIEIPGENPVNAEPAWVVVGPPDYAPGVRSTVTLYDVLLSLAEREGWETLPTRPVFNRDIRPIIERTRSLRWVHRSGVQDWGDISNDWARLSDASATEETLRRTTVAQIKMLQQALRNFSLQEWQVRYLEEWEAGRFDVDVPAANQPPANDPRALTRSVMDGTVGQGFLPGIECGILMLDPGIYSQPFDLRLSHAVVEPGWMTALMALPWQADFLKCETRWWPSQRPDLSPQSDASFELWSRPLDAFNDHRKITEDKYVMDFGVVTPSPTGTDPERQVEEGRNIS